MRDAWERLKQVEVPGVPLDQRFRITGPAYYVSPQGDDGADGSEAHPWKTLACAASRLRPGMVILLSAGTYHGPVQIRTRATEGLPAALRARPGQEVVVTYGEDFVREQRNRIVRTGREGALGADGQSLHYPSLITLTGTYVEVSGLHLKGVRDRLPMNLYSESGVSVAGGGGRGCRILYNEIENTGHCGVKEMGHGGTGFLIEGNYIHDLGQTSHDHAIYLPAGEVTVRKNLLVNSSGWGVHAYSTPKRLTVSHNVIGGNAEDGVILGGSECRVFNNVFYRNHRGAVFFFRRDCRSNSVANNLIFETRAFRYDAMGSSAAADQPRDNVIDYNCIVGGAVTPPPVDRLGRHNLEADPAVREAARLDFRLKPGSPCLGAGDARIQAGFAGRAPDMGLYQTK